MGTPAKLFAMQCDGHPDVVVRASPRGTIVGRVANGDPVTVLQVQGDLIQVRSSSGFTGWSKRENFAVMDFIALQRDGHPEVVVRSSPGGSIVGKMKNGDAVTVRRVQGEHLQVQSRVGLGWAKRDNFTLPKVPAAGQGQLDSTFENYEEPKTLWDFSRYAQIGWLRSEFLVALATVNRYKYPVVYGAREFWHENNTWALPRMSIESPETEKTFLQLALEQKVRSNGWTTLPRYQDIRAHAPEAFATEDELAEWVVPLCHEGKLWPQLMSVSHPWWARGAPDVRECGECVSLQLQKLIDFCCEGAFAGGDGIENHEIVIQPPYKFVRAFFFDFSSLPQCPGRTVEQSNNFRRALEHMHLLYVHKSTIVLRITESPPKGVSNPTPYEERGWCALETRVAHLSSSQTYDSTICKPSLSRRMIHEASEDVAGHELEKEPERVQVITPVAFRHELNSLHFAAKGTDQSVVGDLYEKVYNMCCHPKKACVFRSDLLGKHVFGGLSSPRAVVAAASRGSAAAGA